MSHKSSMDEQRRINHNRVERVRKNKMNQHLSVIAQMLPRDTQEDKQQSMLKVVEGAASYIENMQRQFNDVLRQKGNPATLKEMDDLKKMQESLSKEIRNMSSAIRVYGLSQHTNRDFWKRRSQSKAPLAPKEAAILSTTNGQSNMSKKKSSRRQNTVSMQLEKARLLKEQQRQQQQQQVILCGASGMCDPQVATRVVSQSIVEQALKASGIVDDVPAPHCISVMAQSPTPALPCDSDSGILGCVPAGGLTALGSQQVAPGSGQVPVVVQLPGNDSLRSQGSAGNSSVVAAPVLSSYTTPGDGGPAQSAPPAAPHLPPTQSAPSAVPHLPPPQDNTHAVSSVPASPGQPYPVAFLLSNGDVLPMASLASALNPKSLQAVTPSANPPVLTQPQQVPLLVTHLARESTSTVMSSPVINSVARFVSTVVPSPVINSVARTTSASTTHVTSVVKSIAAVTASPTAVNAAQSSVAVGIIAPCAVTLSMNTTAVTPVKVAPVGAKPSSEVTLVTTRGPEKVRVLQVNNLQPPAGNRKEALTPVTTSRTANATMHGIQPATPLVMSGSSPSQVKIVEGVNRLQSLNGNAETSSGTANSAVTVIQPATPLMISGTSPSQTKMLEVVNRLQSLDGNAETSSGTANSAATVIQPATPLVISGTSPSQMKMLEVVNRLQSLNGHAETSSGTGNSAVTVIQPATPLVISGTSPSQTKMLEVVNRLQPLPVNGNAETSSGTANTATAVIQPATPLVISEPSPSHTSSSRAISSPVLLWQHNGQTVRFHLDLHSLQMLSQTKISAGAESVSSVSSSSRVGSPLPRKSSIRTILPKPVSPPKTGGLCSTVVPSLAVTSSAVATVPSPPILSSGMSVRRPKRNSKKSVKKSDSETSAMLRKTDSATTTVMVHPAAPSSGEITSRPVRHSPTKESNPILISEEDEDDAGTMPMDQGRSTISQGTTDQTRSSPGSKQLIRLEDPQNSTKMLQRNSVPQSDKVLDILQEEQGECTGSLVERQNEEERRKTGRLDQDQHNQLMTLLSSSSSFSQSSVSSSPSSFGLPVPAAATVSTTSLTGASMPMLMSPVEETPSPMPAPMMDQASLLSSAEGPLSSDLPLSSLVDSQASVLPPQPQSGKDTSMKDTTPQTNQDCDQRIPGRETGASDLTSQPSNLRTTNRSRVESSASNMAKKKKEVRTRKEQLQEKMEEGVRPPQNLQSDGHSTSLLSQTLDMARTETSSPVCLEFSVDQLGNLDDFVGTGNMELALHQYSEDVSEARKTAENQASTSVSSVHLDISSLISKENMKEKKSTESTAKDFLLFTSQKKAIAKDSEKKMVSDRFHVSSAAAYSGGPEDMSSSTYALSNTFSCANKAAASSSTISSAKSKFSNSVNSTVQELQGGSQLSCQGKQQSSALTAVSDQSSSVRQEGLVEKYRSSSASLVSVSCPASVCATSVVAPAISIPTQLNWLSWPPTSVPTPNVSVLATPSSLARQNLHPTSISAPVSALATPSHLTWQNLHHTSVPAPTATGLATPCPLTWQNLPHLAAPPPVTSPLPSHLHSHAPAATGVRSQLTWQNWSHLPTSAATSTASTSPLLSPTLLTPAPIAARVTSHAFLTPSPITTAVASHLPSALLTSAPIATSVASHALFTLSPTTSTVTAHALFTPSPITTTVTSHAPGVVSFSSFKTLPTLEFENNSSNMLQKNQSVSNSWSPIYCEYGKSKSRSATIGSEVPPQSQHSMDGSALTISSLLPTYTPDVSTSVTGSKTAMSGACSLTSDHPATSLFPMSGHCPAVSALPPVSTFSVSFQNEAPLSSSILAAGCFKVKKGSDTPGPDTGLFASTMSKLSHLEKPAAVNKLGDDKLRRPRPGIYSADNFVCSSQQSSRSNPGPYQQQLSSYSGAGTRRAPGTHDSKGFNFTSIGLNLTSASTVVSRPDTGSKSSSCSTLSFSLSLPAPAQPSLAWSSSSYSQPAAPFSFLSSQTAHGIPMSGSLDPAINRLMQDGGLTRDAGAPKSSDGSALSSCPNTCINVGKMIGENVGFSMSAEKRSFDSELSKIGSVMNKPSAGGDLSQGLSEAGSGRSGGNQKLLSEVPPPAQCLPQLPGQFSPLPAPHPPSDSLSCSSSAYFPSLNTSPLHHHSPVSIPDMDHWNRGLDPILNAQPPTSPVHRSRKRKYAPSSATKKKLVYTADANFASNLLDSNQSFSSMFSFQKSSVPPMDRTSQGNSQFLANSLLTTTSHPLSSSSEKKTSDLGPPYPLFHPPSHPQNTIGLNFQTGFGMGANHNNTSVTPHSVSVTPHVNNFTLGNILSDVPGSTGDPPIKFHNPANTILPPPPPQAPVDSGGIQPQHQGTSLYHNRPHPRNSHLLPNAMTLTTFLGHNRGFDTPPSWR